MPAAYRIISFGNPLNLGVAGSYYANIQSVAKCNTPGVPYCVPNELICNEIGRLLRLPLPPAGILYAPNHDTRYWFASLDFNLTGDSLPPVDPALCVEKLPMLSAGLLLFDILIANSDRHPGNLSLNLEAHPPAMTIFDHSHALFGHASGKGRERLGAMRERLAITGDPTFTGGNRHCLLSLIPDDKDFAEWTTRIAQIPDYFIDDVCRSAVDLGITRLDADAAADFLKYRRTNLPTIIARHKSDFPGIRQWRLVS